MSTQNTKEALWRIPFTPLPQSIQQLAQRVLSDLQKSQRHKYWDVECLQESLRKNTFSDILAEIADDPHQESPKLHKALSEEFARLQNWNTETEPQKLLVLWRDRAFCEGWFDVAQSADNILFDARWASLQRVSTLQKSAAELGFDPNRIGLLTTPNGKFLLDIDSDTVTVWNPHNGEQKARWTPPAQITASAPLLDDIVAFGLENGSLYHWELGEDTQYEVHKLEKSIETISTQDETCAIFSRQHIHVIDAQGTQTHLIPFRSDDTPIIYISQDQERLICCDRETLLVWNLIENTQIFSLSNSDTAEEDVEQMSNAILDMCAHQRGMQLLDAVSLWELPLEKQFQLVQALHEPMALSQDCERLVSFEEGTLKIFARGEGRHYSTIHEEKLHNIWGINTIVPLTKDCSVLATAIPEGIIAWDIQEGKFSSLPLPFTFTTTLHSIPNSRLIAVDTGQSVSIFRFVSL